MPTKLSTLRESIWKAAPVSDRKVTFDTDAAGWRGVDQIEHQAAGGYVTVSRAGRNLPIAYSPVTSAESPLAGDWPIHFGGRGAEITCRVRAPKAGGRVQIEIFAGDAAQWTHETTTSFGPDWQTATAILRYGWTDEEAKAAGWKPSPVGFSWEETIRNIGKVVVVPTAVGATDRFDLDDVRVRGLGE